VYDYLEGRLAAEGATEVVLDVGGVGYALSVPLGTSPRENDEGKVRIWTHLVVREDAHTLFGFADRDTRELFRTLLRVRGVGPGMALGILSGLSGEELLGAIVEGDTAPFTAIKGVGKKTAEQILLDLGDKAPRMFAARAEAGTLVPRRPAGAGPSRPRIFEDAVRALTSIGYTEKQAEKSVERAAARVDTEDLELLVRTALQE